MYWSFGRSGGVSTGSVSVAILAQAYSLKPNQSFILFMLRILPLAFVQLLSAHASLLGLVRFGCLIELAARPPVAVGSPVSDGASCDASTSLLQVDLALKKNVMYNESMTDSFKKGNLHNELVSGSAVEALLVAVSSLSTLWQGVIVCIGSSLCTMIVAHVVMPKDDPDPSEVVVQSGTVPQSKKIRNSGYRPDIDGLRAVAVIAVVIFHVRAAWLPGGYVGVDVFFVISGYVVTGSLIRRNSLGNVEGLIGFYTARIKRLVPNSMCTIFVTGLIVCLFVPKWQIGWIDTPGRMYKSGQYATFAAANILFGSLHQSYWDTGAMSLEMNPYTHMWSLGVEEQYYMFYPVILMLLHGGAPTTERLEASPWRSRTLLGLCAGVSLVAYVYVAAYNSTAAFYYLPYRFWELAIGGWLYECQATYGEDRWEAIAANPLLHTTCEFLAIVFIGGAICMPNIEDLTTGMRMGAGVFGAVACIMANHVSDGNLRRILSTNLMVDIGNRSYSIYLWHWPILTLFRWTVGLNSLATIATAVFLIFLIASAAYDSIEKPARQWGGHTLQVFAALVAAACLCQGWLTILHHSELTAVPIMCKVSEKSPGSTELAAHGLLHQEGRIFSGALAAFEIDRDSAGGGQRAVVSASRADESCRCIVPDSWDNGDGFVQNSPQDAHYCANSHDSSIKNSTPRRKILVVGDSHADHARVALNASLPVRALYEIEMLNRVHGKGFIRGAEDDGFVDKVFHKVDEMQPNGILVLAHKNSGHIEDDQLQRVRRLQQAVRERNSSLIIFGDNPNLLQDMQTCVPTWLRPDALSSCEVSVQHTAIYNKADEDFARRLASEDTSTHFFRRWPLYCDDSTCGPFLPGTCTLAYSDSDHVNTDGRIHSTAPMCSFMKEIGLL